MRHDHHLSAARASASSAHRRHKSLIEPCHLGRNILQSHGVEHLVRQAVLRFPSLVHIVGVARVGVQINHPDAHVRRGGGIVVNGVVARRQVPERAVRVIRLSRRFAQEIICNLQVHAPRGGQVMVPNRAVPGETCDGGSCGRLVEGVPVREQARATRIGGVPGEARGVEGIISAALVEVVPGVQDERAGGAGGAQRSADAVQDASSLLRLIAASNVIIGIGCASEVGA